MSIRENIRCLIDLYVQYRWLHAIDREIDRCNRTSDRAKQLISKAKNQKAATVAMLTEYNKRFGKSLKVEESEK